MVHIDLISSTELEAWKGDGFFYLFLFKMRGRKERVLQDLTTHVVLKHPRNSGGSGWQRRALATPATIWRRTIPSPSTCISIPYWLTILHILRKTRPICQRNWRFVMRLCQTSFEKKIICSIEIFYGFNHLRERDSVDLFIQWIYFMVRIENLILWKHSKHHLSIKWEKDCFVL